MYHPKLIEINRAKVEPLLSEMLPHGLTEYTPEQVAEFRARMADVHDPKTGQQIRGLSKEESRFVLNEQIFSKLSYEYFASRYWTINLAGQALGMLYPLWETQQLVLAQLANLQWERYQADHPDGVIADLLKDRQIGGCVDPTTRVLTADLRWVPIDNIHPGDVVVSVEEWPDKGKGKGRRMCRAVVEARRDVFEPAYKLTFATGESVTATGNHRFLSKKGKQTDTYWREVHTMQVGDVIRYVTQPWGDSTYEDGWAGGILDGECCLNKKPGGGAALVFTQLYGAVHDRYVRYLADRGYTHRKEPDIRSARPGGKFSSRPVGRICVNRMNELFHLIGQTRPVRFLARDWWVGKNMPGKCSGQAWARITSITPLGQKRMVDLQTSTKTYIAEGLVSHNSTLIGSMLGHRIVTHGNINGLLASDEPDNSAFLYDMFERGVDNLPFYLKPTIAERVKNDEMVFKTGSRLMIGASKSTRGADNTQSGGSRKGQLGRGKTLSVVHLSELATYTNPSQVDTALDPGIARSPFTLWIKESTAQGRGKNNWWYQDWQAQKSGKGRGIAIFIGWYVEKARHRLPPPPDWTPSEDTLKHARRIEETSPRWMAGKVYRPTLEQLCWYEFAKAEATSKDNLEGFLQEHPADDEEAFQYSGKSVVSVLVRERIKNQARGLHGMVEVKTNRELGMA